MSGELSKLEAPEGANKRKKRLGRGIGSGHGKQSGRGAKGQKARKSGNVRIGFEGGQLPIQRRMPKAGFKNPFTKHFAEVKLAELEKWFSAGAHVDMQALRDKGIVKGNWDGFKVLATGELNKKLTLTLNRISKAARARIEQLGGSIELIPDREKWRRTDTRAAKRASKKAAG